MSRQASGLMAWLLQRATAVYLAFFSTYLVLYWIFNPPASHADLVTWVTHPAVAMGLILFVPVVLAHAWVGSRDVLVDYVHVLGLRVGLMLLFGFVFLASGLWALKAIITAGIGG
ncbi:succinate dehydrogenase, hydrophobic membrane anchor protein [Thiorhodococcus mannitoliphagus]|uniref:Succinate dehydrogenase hydrophobic membrane anchor subunit n=1 Tax=Thiorhodococcus mannitoliphagus TaxID=329406 RepID=A0A6P1DRL9_9GAMM|nr:succinate dehydrogenase, hydrophobic membrane anchor protein [Thiorhodococcus mannitoliphagus]NEX19813.1 succinate dehydrogenase, hydrophobic membrane anchor protein [Thiorhodococcus mannitoliphagus]